MIALLDTNNTQWKTASSEIDYEIAEFHTPMSNRAYRGGKFAVDNGAFSGDGFQPKAFLALLEKLKPHREKCLFVACPDVVCDARRTLEVFHYWYPKLNGWPVSLVMQNGIENLDIPWSVIDAIFIGGDDDFKLSNSAVSCIRAAQAIGKWVHAGRVNTPARLREFERLGVDSFRWDGDIEVLAHEMENKSPSAQLQLI